MMSLSPHALAWAIDEDCDRCTWMQLHGYVIPQPMNFPPVVKAIDKQMGTQAKEMLQGIVNITDDLAYDHEPIDEAVRSWRHEDEALHWWIRTQYDMIAPISDNIRLTGKADIVLVAPNDNRCIIIDAKLTASPERQQIKKYSYQLGGYELLARAKGLEPIESAILTFSPEKMQFNRGRAYLGGILTYSPIKGADRDTLDGRMNRAFEVYALPNPPAGKSYCAACHERLTKAKAIVSREGPL